MTARDPPYAECALQYRPDLRRLQKLYCPNKVRGCWCLFNGDGVAELNISPSPLLLPFFIIIFSLSLWQFHSGIYINQLTNASTTNLSTHQPLDQFTNPSTTNPLINSPTRWSTHQPFDQFTKPLINSPTLPSFHSLINSPNVSPPPLTKLLTNSLTPR